MQYIHNPRCSKSRQGLELLKSQGHMPEVILYLQEPLAKQQIKQLFQQLGFSDVKQMMRTKEAEFKAMNLASASTEQLFEAMATTPKLIERPILVHQNKAAIGRPPEQLLDIL